MRVYFFFKYRIYGCLYNSKNSITRMYSHNYKIFFSTCDMLVGGDSFWLVRCCELGINQFLEKKDTIWIDIQYTILKITLW
jgi:hypothetical protein